MPFKRNKPGSAKSVLLLMVLFGVLSVIVSRRISSPDVSTDGGIMAAPGAESASPDSHDPEGSPAPVGGGPRLDAATVCVNVGYLCAQVEESGTMQILRWPDDTGVIRVRVPLPEHEPSAQAREFQRAAIRGIQAWQGHPFDLSIQGRSREDPADIVVTWHQQIGGSRLGQASIQWIRRGSEITMRVDGLLLATRSPYDAQRQLSPRQVELVAAHEMGHALGLPHSDDRRDVMYPQNTASHLTNRDYRTMVAVYEIPNGAVIQRAP